MKTDKETLEFIKTQMEIDNKVLYIPLWYPRVETNPDTIDIDLNDVRASDGLRIRYDFDRDGWVVMQMKSVNNNVWVEVGFFRSWAVNEDKD